MSYILIVDNDASVREVLSLALADDGFEVRTVPHGAAALACILERRPALIVLEPHLPIMDGWEFVEAYHQTPGPYATIISLCMDSIPVATTVDLTTPCGLSEL